MTIAMGMKAMLPARSHTAATGRRSVVVVRAAARPSAVRVAPAEEHVAVERKSADQKETRLNSTSGPVVTALAAGGLLGPLAEYFNTLGLPEPLVHWGHPGNMAVVLIAMGGYGSWLGWQIRVGDDADTVAKAQDLHPTLMGLMTFFFALGASGGMLSLLMQGKPIFQSAHVWTGLTGLACLGLNGMLSLFFEDDANARTAHAFFGTGIMALFVVHAALGLQLGLSI
eukprot:CAMPEP_0177789792 /NCGR_PEP_ID=MMETSP0491_2-20121128/22965_1 /TAXON_ID=63592 /ORGANISM="Tetraselmis chuii, Strain PLY429" /LENGTH=226 /DNA_ID=CAMNT_0019311733 /DNA_START=38 /DNA_END=718 /DNA_ORIENTATION=-